MILKMIVNMNAVTYSVNSAGLALQFELSLISAPICGICG